MTCHSSDFRTDSEKDLSRQYNIAQVKRLPSLYNRFTGKLKRDWMELAGEGAPTLQRLLDHNMLGPAKFHGVDRRQSVYQGLVETFGKEDSYHRFYCNDLETILPEGKFRNVGVLNWDSLHPAGGRLFLDDLDCVIRFAKKQEPQGFALILNVEVDGRHGYGVADFRASLEARGIPISEEHLKTPGVLYGGHLSNARKHRSRRLNYCVLFGLPSILPRF